jgi:hypothetical protein
MKTINLLPREPFAKQYFIPILAAILVICVTTGATLIVVGNHYKSVAEMKRLALEETRSKIIQLSKERVVDPLTTEFNTFTTAIKNTKELRRSWPTFLKALSAVLPNASRITSIQSASDGTLALQMDFTALEDVTAFLVNTQALSEVGSVAIKSVTTTSMSIPKQAPAPELSNQQIPVGGTSTSVQTIPAQTGVTQPASTQTKPQSDSEQLLDQLNAMVTRQLGITVPDIPDVTMVPQASVSPDSALTQQDFDNARAKLEELKRTPAGKMSGSTTAPTSTPSASTTGTIPATNAAQDDQVKLYKVSIEIKLKPITPVK